jgi:hypothetical protein
MAKTLKAEVVQLGLATAPQLMTGTVDPSAGGGVPAPLASLYLRGGATNQTWQKTGAPDTSWTRRPALLSITVEPAAYTMWDTDSRQYTATGVYQSGPTQDLTALVVWASSDATKATVTVGGLVAGVAAGTTNITATLGLVVGTSPLLITAANASFVAWSQMRPISSPAAKQFFQMTYDIPSDKFIIFGGGDNTTWSMNAALVGTSGATWVQENPATVPGARVGSGMYFDVANNNSVIAGGAFDSTCFSGDGATWTAQADPVTSEYCYSTYDFANSLGVLWNGANGALTDSYQTFDGTTWSAVLTPATRPPAGQQTAMFSDNVFTWMVGGTGANPTHLWALDVGTGIWADQFPLNPLPLATNGMGGCSNTADNTGLVLLPNGMNTETWKFDNAGAGWSQVATAQAPSARRGMGVAYDALRNRFLMYGGDVGSTETWCSS